jgi:hypothetical protein
MTDRRQIKCRHRHDALATVLYYIPEGCNCFPDPVQALCEQHAIKCHSTGPIVKIMNIEEQDYGAIRSRNPRDAGVAHEEW